MTTQLTLMEHLQCVRKHSGILRGFQGGQDTVPAPEMLMINREENDIHESFEYKTNSGTY